jgi:dTDP-D-glucose 4,6-dehydratase
LAAHFALQYSSSYRIIAIDNYSRPASHNNLLDLQQLKNFTFVKGDVGDSGLVTKIMDDYHIDTVLHLAAQTSVDDSFEHPLDSVTSNIISTYVMLECSRKHGIRKFIYMSTDEVYGPCGPDNPADEETLLRPTNPYSASKASGEMLVHSYYKSFKLPVIVVRSNNVYGPHQYPESTSSVCPSN